VAERGLVNNKAKKNLRKTLKKKMKKHR